MKKTLFLTCALALASFVGVSAQTWCRTVACGQGEAMETENGKAMHKGQTPLISNAGAEGVRFTVIATAPNSEIKGGGPCFALGEMQILNEAGEAISYSVTSNADHNTMGGAGNDGQGYPALSDGVIEEGNYWHSTWSASAPDAYHYLEFTFEEPVDAFQLVWYTRPGSDKNNPTVVGLSNPGVDFTDEMLYAEYEYSLGAKVADASELAGENKFFTFYAEGPTEFGQQDNGEPFTGPGNVYVALSGYSTGTATEASPTNILQLIAGNEGKYVIYQPILETYYGNPDNWTDGYNGTNGWQRATSSAAALAEFEFTKRADGDFELTTYATRQYIDGAWQEYATPLKLWVGYDMRGQLKLFPQALKEALEAGDYTKGFSLPVDFGFTIYNANVADGLIEPVSVTSICENVINPTIEQAREKMEQYAEYEEYGDGEREALEDAIADAEAAIEDNDIAGIFVAKDAVVEALVEYVLIKANYYEEVLGELEDAYDENNGNEEGNYTITSQGYINDFEELLASVWDMTSVSAIESAYATLESLATQFYGSTLKFFTFPSVVDSISNATSSDFPNNAIWKQQVALSKAISGIRITPLSVYIGSAGGGGLYGGYPMVALGEIKVYDANGTEVTLDESMVYASATETNEGFESTAARLVDGAITGAGSYFHSPWSGTAPTEYVYIEIQFPEAMDMFTLEVYSRDKSTTGGNVSLFPFRAALTNYGEKYDPALFSENPYNVVVGDQITSVDQFTEGLYVIKGLLNTVPAYKYNAETETIELEESAAGEAKFYHGLGRHHNAAAAVREAGVYQVTKNADGTFKMLNLGLAKYWPTTEGEAGERTGALTATYSVDKAANLKIVPSGHLENTFVLYEEVAGLKTVADSVDTDDDGVADAEGASFDTPYVVYMDWSTGLASRPVVATTPVYDPSISDTWGDSLCFNKSNGEGEWEIYKVSMDHADFYWLSNLVGIVSGLGLEVGADPGCVASLGELQEAYDAALACIEAEDYEAAPALAKALAEKIVLVEGLEKNPMKEGVYMIVSAYNEFYKQQGHNKAMYASEDGTTLGWKQLVETGNPWTDNEFYFEFTKSPYATDYSEEISDHIYNIRAVNCGGDAPMYISEVEGLSTQIDLSDYESDYYVRPATGSAFNLALAANPEHCLHSNGHGSGAGTGSNLVYWYGDPGASQWRLVYVGEVGTSVSDLLVEGTEVVSVAYFTPAGAAIPAPVKGVNVVVTVYANGVVETKKVLVK